MKKTFIVATVAMFALLVGCTPAETSRSTSGGRGTISAVDPSEYATQAADDQSPTTTPSPSPTNMPSADTYLPKDDLHTPHNGDTVAIIETDKGTIKMKLFTKDVPELSKNFTELAKAGKYEGSPFHRVVKNFMIQGGDFTNHDGTGGYSYKGEKSPLPNEIVPSIKHLYGTVAMAKTSAPVSIGSQFYIVNNHDGVPFLDGGYSPFGQVYEGMDVVEAISDLQIPGTEQPSEIVNVKKVTIEKYTSPAK